MAKQKYGTLICENCGKEKKKKKISKNNILKYCSKCAKELKNHTKETKFCIDCGVELEYGVFVHRKRDRCPLCQRAYNNKKSAESMQKLRMLRNKAIGENPENP